MIVRRSGAFRGDGADLFAAIESSHARAEPFCDQLARAHGNRLRAAEDHLDAEISALVGGDRVGERHRVRRIGDEIGRLAACKPIKLPRDRGAQIERIMGCVRVGDRPAFAIDAFGIGCLGLGREVPDCREGPRCVHAEPTRCARH